MVWDTGYSTVVFGVECRHIYTEGDSRPLLYNLSVNIQYTSASTGHAFHCQCYIVIFETILLTIKSLLYGNISSQSNPYTVAIVEFLLRALRPSIIQDLMLLNAKVPKDFLVAYRIDRYFLRAEYQL